VYTGKINFTNFNFPLLACRCRVHPSRIMCFKYLNKRSCMLLMLYVKASNILNNANMVCWSEGNLGHFSASQAGIPALQPPKISQAIWDSIGICIKILLSMKSPHKIYPTCVCVCVCVWTMTVRNV